MFCIECGEEALEGALFCHACGEELVDPNKHKSRDIKTEPNKKESSEKAEIRPESSRKANAKETSPNETDKSHSDAKSFQVQPNLNSYKNNPENREHEEPILRRRFDRNQPSPSTMIDP